MSNDSEAATGSIHGGGLTASWGVIVARSVMILQAEAAHHKRLQQLHRRRMRECYRAAADLARLADAYGVRVETRRSDDDQGGTDDDRDQ